MTTRQDCEEATQRGDTPMKRIERARIERVALAICNAIRADHHLPVIADLSSVEDSGTYRRQAKAAIAAYN